MMYTIVQWLVEQGVSKVTLHATEMGRSLYTELGFVAGNEMVLHTGQVPRTWEAQGTCPCLGDPQSARMTKV